MAIKCVDCHKPLSENKLRHNAIFCSYHVIAIIANDVITYVPSEF
jgi:hypothetical protein